MYFNCPHPNKCTGKESLKIITNNGDVLSSVFLQKVN